MAEKVGELYYQVSLDTGEMIRGQRAVDREVGRTTNTLDRFQAKLTQVASAVAAYASAAYIIQRSDQYTKLTAQLRLATEGEAEFAKALGQVRQIAAEAHTDLSSVAVLYARVTNATKELGTTQAEVAAITRTVALALKVSGATAQEAASATLQLSQAFGSGVLRGEEFNAVNEAAPRLMKALADGIGVPIGRLRSMAEAGELTSEVLAKALPRALGELEKEAIQIQTISGAFQLLRNEITLFVGEQANASGAAALTAASIATLAANLDLLAAAALGFATAKIAEATLSIGAATVAGIARAMQYVAALQAQRAAAIAAAQAEVAATAAQTQKLAATQAAIVVSREEAAAQLAQSIATANGATVTIAATRAIIARATAQLEAAKAAGALSFALGIVRESEAVLAAQNMNLLRTEAALTAAMQARSAATAELALLGQQQARVAAQVTAATVAQTAAQTALTRATAAGGAASGLAMRALGLLGGPIGVITTLLGFGVTAWALWGTAAKDNEAKAAEAVERSTDDIVASLDKQIAKLKERNALAGAGMADAAKKDTEQAKKMASLLTKINDLQAGKGIDGSAPLPEAARLALLQDLTKQFGVLAGKSADLNREQDRFNNIGEKTARQKFLEKYATDAERVAAEIAKARKELGSEFTAEDEIRIRQKLMPDKKPVKTADQRFDDGNYLGGLQTAAVEGFAKIDAAEQEALRKNAEHLRKREISEETAAKAVTLIQQGAAKDRLELQDGLDRLIEDKQKDQAKRDIDAEKKREEARLQARKDIAFDDPIELLRIEEEEKLRVVEEARLRDLENSRLYNEQKLAIEQDYAQRRIDVRQREIDMQDRNNAMALAAMTDVAGQMYSLLEKSGKERTALGKAAFLASKALAVAEIIMSTEVAAKKAEAQLGIYGLPMAGVIRATGYASAGMVAGMAIGEVAGGRQYGGPVSAGSLYRINEGGKPEMFTGSNGNQYLLPTKSGNVTPADQVGGRGGWTINIHQAPPGTTATVNEEARVIDIAVGRAKAEIASEFSSNTGQTWNALRGASNVKGRMS